MASFTNFTAFLASCNSFRTIEKISVEWVLPRVPNVVFSRVCVPLPGRRTWRCFLVTDPPVTSTSHQTLTEKIVHRFPQSGTSLCHQHPSSSLERILLLSYFTQSLFILSHLRHQRWFDRNSFLQQVEHDFTHDVYLIHIGMSQHLLSLVMIGLTKNRFDEG